MRSGSAFRVRASDFVPRRLLANGHLRQLSSARATRLPSPRLGWSRSRRPRRFAESRARCVGALRLPLAGRGPACRGADRVGRAQAGGLVALAVRARRREKLWHAGANVICMNTRNCGGTEALSPTPYHSGLFGRCACRACARGVAAGPAGRVMVVTGTWKGESPLVAAPNYVRTNRVEPPLEYLADPDVNYAPGASSTGSKLPSKSPRVAAPAHPIIAARSTGAGDTAPADNRRGSKTKVDSKVLI